MKIKNNLSKGKYEKYCRAYVQVLFISYTVPKSNHWSLQKEVFCWKANLQTCFCQSDNTLQGQVSPTFKKICIAHNL